jgi:hypothetical protein
MTSNPWSRSARVMVFAPRSCPSSPGLATTTRYGRFTIDPVVDIAVGDVAAPGPEWIAAAVEHCAQGLSLLERLDPTGFDAATVEAWAIGVEQLRRQATAAGIAVAGHLDTAQPFRDLGYFTAKAWMKHRLQLSGAEAHGRLQEARLRRAVAVWNNALAGGQVGVAQTRLMARIAANPRIDPDVLARGVWELMADAMDVSYVEFERRALTFEALADPIGAAEKTERNRLRRTASIHQESDGSWALHAQLRRRRRPRVPRNLLLVRRPRIHPRLGRRRPASVTATSTSPTCAAPKPNDEPTHSSRWPALLPRARPTGNDRCRPSTSSSTAPPPKPSPTATPSTPSPTATSPHAPTAAIASSPQRSSACHCGR